MRSSVRIEVAAAVVFLFAAGNVVGQSAEGQATNSNTGAESPALQWLSQPGNSLRGVSLGDDIVFREEASRKDLGDWSLGHKTLLFIRVDFSDYPGGLSTEAEANALIVGANTTYAEYSYGAVSISGTVTPVLRMPSPRSLYTGNLGLVLSDARAAALAAGYNTAQYDLDVVQYVSVNDGDGNGNLGAKGLWLRTTSGGILVHELGHNFGLMHANAWTAVGDTVVGPGTHIEYGNLWDTMGNGNGHFNACHKNRLKWLRDEFVQTVTKSGVYRLYSFDQSVLTTNRIYALKIHKDVERDYWIEHRKQLIPYYENTWLTNGVLLNWSPWSQSAAGTHLLKPLPAIEEANFNTALVMGKTLADLDAQVFIRPLSKAADDEWMDIAVNLGPFPTNRPPITSLSVSATNAAPGQPVQFSINAQDPDGDALGYFWDFGRDNFHVQNGPNAATVTYSFVEQGQRSVFCLVSDGKGGLSVQSVLIQVGASQLYRVSGRVTHHGQPVSGAYVFFPDPTGAYRTSTYTDGVGFFALTGINPSRQELWAMKWTQTFNPVTFTNPLYPTNNTDGIRFDDGLPWVFGPRKVSGGWLVEAAALSGKSYSLLASSNLSQWTAIGQTNAVADNFQFFDSQSIARRFYRLRTD